MPGPSISEAEPTGWRRWLPGVAALAGYQREWLRGDVLAGVTVAAYLVPQVMAYASVAGLPPVVGLWAVIYPLLAYAVFGSSRQLSVGPEATTALMTAAAVAALVGQVGAQRHAEVAAVLALVVGALCLLGRLLRLGFLSNLLSKPVLIGYLAGVAVMMIIGQLGKIARLSIDAAQPMAQAIEFGQRVGDVHLSSLLLGLGTLALLLAMWRFAPQLPGPLLAIIAATVASSIFDLPGRGVAVVGAIPAGLPPLGLPDPGGLQPGALLLTAVGIVMVGYSDNVLTARSFADARGERIDTNQEFLALGVANLAAGFSSGFPVSSSGSRTALGAAVGSRTQLYSLVALVAVLATMFVLDPVLARFPVPALGALVIYAAIRLVDVAQWRRIAHFRRSEFVLALVTAATVVTLGVLQGIGLAILLSMLDLMRRLSFPHEGVIGFVPGLAGMHALADYPEARQLPGLVVYRYDAPIFFANADNFAREALRAVEDADPPVYWFLLNAEAHDEVDWTAADALELLRRSLAERGVIFAMARVKQELRDDLIRIGFLTPANDQYLFPTLPTAVQAYRDWYEGKFGTTAPLP